MFDIPDTDHRESYKEALARACRDLRKDKAALRGITYLHGIYKQAMTAPDAAEGE